MRKTIAVMVAAAAGVALMGALSYGAPKMEFGTVACSEPDVLVEMTLTKVKPVKILVTPKGTQFPVGTYKTVTINMMKKDKSGTVWTVPMSQKSFTVTKDQTTTISVPKTIDVSVMFYGVETASKTGTKSLGITLQFTGSDGQAVGQEVMMGRKLVPAPQLQITDAKDNKLKTDSFSYG